MKIHYTDFFQKRLKKRLEKNQKLKDKVSKQLKLLSENINYPSLKMHKLKGERVEQYAIWIEGDVRIVFLIVDDVILLTDILTHDEY